MESSGVPSRRSVANPIQLQAMREDRVHGRASPQSHAGAGVMWGLVRVLGYVSLSWSPPVTTGLLSSYVGAGVLQPLRCRTYHATRVSHGPRGSSSRMTPQCGLAVTIHIRGKRTGGEEWLNDGYNEYEKRLRPVLSLETVWHKTDDEMVAAVERDRRSSRGVVCMDERGRTFDSQQFADVLYKKLEDGGSRLSIVIGGAEGLPPALKQGSYSKEMWSLSPMTFTHQWARVLLAEQIYRATEIKKGSAYHKA